MDIDCAAARANSGGVRRVLNCAAPTLSAIFEEVSPGLFRFVCRCDRLIDGGQQIDDRLPDFRAGGCGFLVGGRFFAPPMSPIFAGSVFCVQRGEQEAKTPAKCEGYRENREANREARLLLSGSFLFANFGHSLHCARDHLLLNLVVIGHGLQLAVERFKPTLFPLRPDNAGPIGLHEFRA